MLTALAYWLAATGLLAQRANATNNPYQAIVSRNVFGLAPIPPSVATNSTPLPQITLCGTTSIVGRPIALFRLEGIPAPGVTAQETSHILGVGEKELGVKVLEISKDGSSVTFDNHGDMQVLQLEAPAVPWKPPEIPAIFSGYIPEHFGSDRMAIRRMRP